MWSSKVQTSLYIWAVARPRMLSVTYLTADPGAGSLIPTRSHTFVEIDHELFSTAILLLSADSRRAVVSYKWKYVHEVLVNRSVKLAKEKCVVRWTDRPGMTIAVDWDLKYQTRHTSGQSDQHLCYSHSWKGNSLTYNMHSFNTLASLCIRAAWFGSYLGGHP